MAVVRTTGAVNVSSDVAMVSGTALTISGKVASAPVTVKGIYYGVIATAAGITCGAVSLRDGTTVLWKGYAYLSAANAGESQTQWYPLNITYSPTASVNLLHTNVTPAIASANAAIVWY